MNVGMTPALSLILIFREDVSSSRGRSVMCGNGRRSAVIRAYNRLRTNLGWQQKKQLLHRPGARDDRATCSYRPDSVLTVDFVHENDMLYCLVVCRICLLV